MPIIEENYSTPSVLPVRFAPRLAACAWEYPFLLAFAMLLLGPLCRGRSLYWGDIMLYFAPMLHFQQAALQQGHIPLWNPTILGGQPLVGNPQMGVFYPTTSLLFMMPVWLYMSVTTIGHVFLCGICMNAYLRGWTQDRWARLAGSLTYMGSECLIGRIQFPPMIFSAPYFPLLLWCIDRCLAAERAHCGCRRRKEKGKRNSSFPIEPETKDQTENTNETDADYIETDEYTKPFGLHCETCLRVRRQRIWTRIRLSLVVGLLILAAHPQMAYLILVVGSVYALARLWKQALHSEQVLSGKTIYEPGAGSSKHPRVSNLRAFIRTLASSGAGLFGAGLLGLMLSAVQVLPALQVLLESPREKLTPAQANRFYLEPAHLLRLILPRFWGHPATADYWGSGNAWEPAFFVGWLPLLLIGLACFRLRKSRKVMFWLAAALSGIWLAFGNQGGLYWLAFKIVPGLSNFHDPARFLLFTTLAFATLTTIGWNIGWNIGWQFISRRFTRERTEAKISFLRSFAGRFAPLQRAGRFLTPEQSRLLVFTLRSVGIAGIALPLWWYGRDWNPTVPHEFMERQSHALALVKPQSVSSNVTNPDLTNGSLENFRQRIYLPAHEPFWKRYITDGYSDYGSVDALHIQAMLDTLMPNLNMQWGVDSASGYEPVPLSAPANVDALGRLALRRSEPNLSRLLSLMGVGTLLLPSEDHIAASSLALENGRRLEVRAWRNLNVLPRAWLVHSLRRVEGKTRLSAALAAPDFHPEQLALIQDAQDTTDRWEAELELPAPQEKDKQEKDKSANSSPPAHVHLVYSDTHSFQWNVEGGEESGFLVMCATAFPGWQAELDGRPAPLHRVDGALMGLYLPPGSHRVGLQYAPACYRFGGYLSLLACGMLGAAAGWLLASRKRPAS